MHNKFEDDAWKTIIGHYDFFSAIIELVQELLISNMHNKFEEDT